MLLRRSTVAALAVLAISATGCGHLVQQTVLLNEMRSHYYDMRASGAKAFFCVAHPDWPLFISSATGAPSTGALADTPWHRYLQGVTLTFHASLAGGTATVTWDEKAPPPADRADAAKKLEGAFRQMLEGFITAWRPNLTNTLLPAIPISEIKTTPTGYMLTEKDMQGRASDVILDKGMQVTHVTTVGPNLNVDADTKYIKSPKGLLLAEMDSLIKHADGSSTKSEMRATYAEADGFAVPSSFEVDTERTRIHMDFTGCKVEK